MDHTPQDNSGPDGVNCCWAFEPGGGGARVRHEMLKRRQWLTFQARCLAPITYKTLSARHCDSSRSSNHTGFFWNLQDWNCCVDAPPVYSAHIHTHTHMLKWYDQLPSYPLVAVLALSPTPPSPSTDAFLWFGQKVHTLSLIHLVSRLRESWG
ncbi:hypothetical protein BP00DRAFT_255386 [Aspergillus indologenus CBS 114.80]|uniref:Uncharacterized protein n=1 Tax=Aspergillus indologenus CBS 114.80 TaxID=1450541 RepID=A0A2V5IWY1_9EURO|nr:hypothetical protein BP00DRAFT_255386 [Aspergillus indologenus CBS 114.80]